MKKSNILFCIALFVILFFTACGQNSKQSEEITWATTNVGANIPDGYGNYYTWEEAKTACPKGLRLPTINELENLLDEENVTFEWTTLNGIGGRKFDNGSNTIFLPASGGCRFVSYGTIEDVGTSGYYWSITERCNYNAYGLYFSRGLAYLLNYDKASRFSVRCVAE